MEDWSFSENLEWKSKFNKCNMSNQSPINIDSELAIPCNTLCDLQIKYKPSGCNVKFYNGLLTIFYDEGSYIIYKNVPYKLTKITIHTPSMHSIDHEKYDMEICLFHSAGNESDGGVIISCLYEEGPHYGEVENFFNQFINETPAFNVNFEEQIDVSKNWNANMLLPEKQSFFVYNGSMPFPPCTENYYYIVMDNLNHIGSTNLNLLKKYIGNSIRNIQPLNDRKVFYNLGKPIKSAEREVSVTNDKFLRCIKKPNNINSISTSNSPVPTTSSDKNTSAFKPENKRYIKSIFTLINIIIVLVNAYFFTIYLYKYEYVQSFMSTLVGSKAFMGQAPISLWRQDCKVQDKDLIKEPPNE